MRDYSYSKTEYTITIRDLIELFVTWCLSCLIALLILPNFTIEDICTSMIQCVFVLVCVLISMMRRSRQAKNDKLVKSAERLLAALEKVNDIAQDTQDTITKGYR